MSIYDPWCFLCDACALSLMFVIFPFNSRSFFLQERKFLPSLSLISLSSAFFLFHPLSLSLHISTAWHHLPSPRWTKTCIEMMMTQRKGRERKREWDESDVHSTKIELLLSSHSYMSSHNVRTMLEQWGKDREWHGKRVQHDTMEDGMGRDIWLLAGRENSLIFGDSIVRFSSLRRKQRVTAVRTEVYL